MAACPECSAAIPEGSKFCPECGRALAPSGKPTVTQTGEYRPGNANEPSPESSGHGRFLPGTKVAGRYRIVSLLGKGGMGEVYRADDLTLGHPVALKFLPKDLADDPRRLEFFHREVRLSRQIAHPNVCRVYDIGEIDGHHFLSMEYIDGEDLGVLLRRIGRLPADKGVQIAQQLCAGLAAAHDKGVLHRDVKPANIMLDGHGQVRITDFGLAQLATEGVPGEIVGTPAYMAPEQLTRGETTIQSDLYSLGLILYELFTGKRVFEGRTLSELMREHEESSPLPPSGVEDMDPIVEQVILRCLAKEPHERPLSAYAVAAALPGGDPLAAALAAGETPSPELVAAAGGTGSLSLRTGIACLALVLVGLIAYPYIRNLGPFGQLFGQSGLSPEGKEPSVLQHDLRQQILKLLGYYDPDDPPDHSVYGLDLQQQPDGSRRLEFWYRQRNSGFLTPEIGEFWRGLPQYTLTLSNPPPYQPGMVSARVDLQGNLIELLAIPEGHHGKAIDDAELFNGAGHPFDRFEKVTEAGPLRKWVPPVHADRTAIYRPRQNLESKLRIFTAHRDGRLVYFYAGPLKDAQPVGRRFVEGSDQSANERTVLSWTIVSTASVVSFVAAIFLGLRNVRLARADRRGALRLAQTVAAIHMLLWLFAIHHVPSFPREVMLLRSYIWPTIYIAFLYWLLYVALEPYVRRYWPGVLIAWTRVLEGRFRDPLPGRDLLIGCLAGVGAALLAVGVNVVAMQLDAPASVHAWFRPNSPLQLTALALSNARAMIITIWLLMVLFLCRVALRKEWLAIAGFSMVGTGLVGYAGIPLSHVLTMLIFYAGLTLMLTRCGLFAAMAFHFATLMMWKYLTTPDVTAWYGHGTLVALGSVAAVALYGYYTSTMAPRTATRPGTG